MIIETNEDRPRHQRMAEDLRPGETVERPKRERAKRQAPAAKPSWKYYAWGLTGVVIVFLFLWVGSIVDEFLATDPRFALVAPEEVGEVSPNLQIIGLKRADRDEILKVFSHDLGKSIYLVPLAERRERLTKIDWIRDAAVLRIWPNRIQIQLTERVPVASLHLPPTPRDLELNQDFHLALVDAEGAILTPHGEAKPPAPVVTGIDADTAIETRKAGVQRVMKLMREAGHYRDRVTRVDASDPNNLKLYQRFMEREIILLLGHEKFFVRMDNYFTNLENLPQSPDIPGFDLRPENQIIALSPVMKGDRPE